MNRVWKILMSIRSLVLVAIVAALFPAIESAMAQPLTIRIGTPDQSVGPRPSGGLSVPSYLDAKKLLDQEFAKDGISIQWVFFKGAGPAINEALANKQLDFAYIGDLAAILGRANGLATRFILPFRGTNSFLLATPESGIRKLEDLKGKRVTVFKGTAYQLSFDRSLARVGLTERDLQVVSLDWSGALAAIAAKQLDADWAGVSALTLRDKGLAQLVTSSKELGRESTILSGFVATQAFIDDHPDLTQRLVNVLVSTEHWLSDPANLDEYFRVGSEVSGVPASLGKAEIEGDDPKFRYSPRIDEFVVEAFQTGIDQAKELGLIRKTFEARTWVEPRFVDAALKSQKLEDFWPLFDKQGNPQAK
jgi:sulfonate transport system substrate-binding protein